MAVELFTNLASTTVSSGGTTAPAPGTTESWTVASSASFPAAVSGTSQFHIQEDDSVKQSEIILVTNVSGTTWSVTRGVEGTTPVAHTTGFTVIQTVTASFLGTVRTTAVPLTAADIGAGLFPVGTNTFQAATSGVGLVVKAAATTPGDIQEWKNSGGSTLSAIDSLGFFYAPGIGDIAATGSWFSLNPTGTDSGAVLVKTRATGNIGLAVRATSGQTASLQEWQSSTPAALASVSATGQGTFAGVYDGANHVFSAGNLPTAAQVTPGTFSGAGFSFSSGFSTSGGFSAVGAISSITGVQSNFASTATSGSPTSSSGYVNLTTSYWNGSSASQAVASLLATVASPSGATTLTATAGTLATTGALTAAGLLTANSGVTIPSGQPLTVGTKKTFSGTLALAATANAATVLGQFSSTAGSMALRLHIHLVTGSVQRTKTYEVVVDTTTDTTNTYYKLLPADQSTAQAAASDVALEIYRPSTATTTWQIWVRTTPTFASTGAITWSAEGYGDTVLTYASTLSPATSASGSPITAVLHPSNALDTAAGNVGIGTDTPAALLDVRGTLLAYAGNAVVTSSTSTANKLTVSANASPPSSPATGDLWIVSDVTAPSTPLAPLGYVAGNSSTTATTTLSTTIGTETAVAPTATFTPVTGRRYRLSMSARANAGVSNQLVALRLNSSSGSTRLMEATTLLPVTGGQGQQTITQVRTIQAGDTGFPAGTSCTFTLVATQTSGTTTTAASIVASAAGALTNFIIEDIGV